MATFRLLTASLLQTIRSTDCTVSFISQRSTVIGVFVPLFRRVAVPSVVRCCTVLLLLCFFIVGIHASGISIPPSLLMLLG